MSHGQLWLKAGIHVPKRPRETSEKSKPGRGSPTKGSSTKAGTKYGNFVKGNKDKLMISYFRDPSHDYAMAGSCGVVYKGLGVTEVYGWNDYGYVEIRTIFFASCAIRHFFRIHRVVQTLPTPANQIAQLALRVLRLWSLEYGAFIPRSSRGERTRSYRSGINRDTSMKARCISLEVLIITWKVPKKISEGNTSLLKATSMGKCQKWSNTKILKLDSIVQRVPVLNLHTSLLKQVLWTSGIHGLIHHSLDIWWRYMSRSRPLAHI